MFHSLVFTAKGGVERHVEAVIGLLATALAEGEGSSPEKMKAEMLERISLTLARHAARAVVRRQTRPATASWGSGVARRFLWEASARGAAAEVEADCAHLHNVEGCASIFQ